MFGYNPFLIKLVSISSILIHAISAEATTIEYDGRYDHYKAGFEELLITDESIVNESNENQDFLVNADVDAYILGTVQLFESRLRPNTKDGDCYAHFTKHGNMSISKTECRSVGNMQISKGAVKWIKNIDSENFKDLTIDQLRTPEVNTRVGYKLLKYFKASCKSSLPGVWLTAFGEGHCPKNNQLDREGIRRCAVLTEALNASGVIPPNWKCGNEGKKMKDETALKFIKKIKELNNEDPDVEEAKN